jgi:branched-chain amino acid transport system substrate-binding protein
VIRISKELHHRRPGWAGNPLGALVGGLVLGVLEGLLPLTMPNTWVPVIEFLLFILILLIKPSGLLGGRSE